MPINYGLKWVSLGQFDTTRHNLTIDAKSKMDHAHATFSLILPWLNFDMAPHSCYHVSIHDLIHFSPLCTPISLSCECEG